MKDLNMHWTALFAINGNHHHCLFTLCQGIGHQRQPSNYPYPVQVSGAHSSRIHQVFLGLPLILWPCGFHASICLVRLPGGFLKMWPSHCHFLLPNSSGILFCPFLFQSSSFLILSGHLILKICLRHVFPTVLEFVQESLGEFLCFSAT